MRLRSIFRLELQDTGSRGQGVIKDNLSHSSRAQRFPSIRDWMVKTSQFTTLMHVWHGTVTDG